MPAPKKKVKYIFGCCECGKNVENTSKDNMYPYCAKCAPEGHEKQEHEYFKND